MALKNGDFIKINYTGKLKDGKIFDTTIESISKENNTYNENGIYGGDIIIIGAQNTIKGLDESFIGKNVGDEIEIELNPEEAFGITDSKLITSMSTSKFKDGKIIPGVIVEQDGKQGIVIRVIGRSAIVDFNNPLCGKTVIYKYKIEKQINYLNAQIQGIFTLYTGIKETSIEIENNIASIFIPSMLTFNQKWLLMKKRLFQDITSYTNINEVRYVEKYIKENKEI